MGASLQSAVPEGVELVMNGQLGGTLAYYREDGLC